MPTKTLVASPYAAHVARRVADLWRHVRRAAIAAAVPAGPPPATRTSQSRNSGTRRGGSVIVSVGRARLSV